MDITAQQQAIIDKLVGAPYEALPPLVDLEPPWRTIFGRVSRAGSYGQAHSFIWKAIIEHDPDAPCLLRTVRGMGYRFEVPDSDPVGSTTSAPALTTPRSEYIQAN